MHPCSYWHRRTAWSGEEALGPEHTDYRLCVSQVAREYGIRRMITGSGEHQTGREFPYRVGDFPELLRALDLGRENGLEDGVQRAAEGTVPLNMRPHIYVEDHTRIQLAPRTRLAEAFDDPADREGNTQETERRAGNVERDGDGATRPPVMRFRARLRAASLHAKRLLQSLANPLST
eukprot:4058960-Pyramimonas_sp.AAC.2